METLATWREEYPKETPCPIWGTPARAKPASEGGGADASVEYFSPRAGGAFFLAPSAARSLASITALVEGNAAPDSEGAAVEAWRLALSNWVVEHQLRGETVCLDGPRLDTLFHQASAEPARARGDLLSLRERGDRLLLLLARLSPDFSAPVVVDEDAWQLALAWSATKNRQALWFALRDLERRSCVDLATRVSAEGPQQIATIQRDGLQRLKDLREMLSAPSVQTLFVAMWDYEGARELLDTIIAPAAAEVGLQAVYFPRAQGNNKPAAEPLPAIRNAKAVLVEMTGDPKTMAAGGLWFEAGFALGVGVPMLWSCKNETALLNALAIDAQSAPAGFMLWQDAEAFGVLLRDALKRLAVPTRAETSEAQED